MIHVHDQDFEEHVRDVFHEAYMTHTSTSPNYQILASLDVGRRQLELEGYELVRNSVGLAMMIRRQIVLFVGIGARTPVKGDECPWPMTTTSKSPS